MKLTTFIFKIRSWAVTLNTWFEINCGWFFVNGRKQEDWQKYIKTKYHNERSKP